MKNLKTMACITFCVLASFAMLLLSPFAINTYASVEDKGTSYAQNTQTRYLTIDSNKTILFDEHIENLYTISSCNNSTSGGNNGDISYDKNNKSITFSTSSNAIDKKNPRIETAFKLHSKYARAIQNGIITINLKVKIANKNASTQIGVQEGTIITNGVDGYNGWTANGGYVISKDISSLQKDGDYYTVSFVPTSTDILLVFANVKSGGGINKNELTITEPTIELTTNASSAISIKDVLVNGKNEDTSWTKDDKNLTFTVEDNNVGIDYVLINGVKVECDEATKNTDTLKTYTYKVNSIAETNYTIVAYDYLGGTTTITKKVGFVDKQDVDDIVINAEKSYHEKNISIDISFTEDTTHSHDYVFYTLIDNSTGEDPTPNPNDTTGKTKQVPHQNGNYTFDFAFEYDGEYTLTLLIIDEAGHSKTFSHNFIIDSVKRRVNVVSHNGTFNITGVFTDEYGYYTWNGENISLNYSANQNFSFYKLLRNGSEVQTNGSVYNYTCRDADINIEIFNRFVVTVNAQKTYEFNEDGTNLIFTLNASNLINVLSMQELSSLLQEEVQNLTDEEILEKVENLISSSLVFTIKYNGFATDSIYNRGTYNISYSINTSNFTGFGNFDIVVTQKALQVEYLENNFIYNGNIQNINYSALQGHTISEKYYLITNGVASSEETVFKNAGTYKVVLTLGNDNYCLTNGEIEVCIYKKQINVNVTSTNFTYNVTNQNIVYTLTEEIESLVKYFVNDEEGNLLESSFINAGNYTYVILPIDEENYEILNNTGFCQILKVTANIQVNNLVYNYTGNTLNLNYTVTNENGEEIAVNNLFITYYVNNEETEFCNPNQYNFVFSTLDSNYNLEGTLTGTATIKKTIINVFVNTTTYEYTGSEIVLDFYFVNEENEILTNLKNISLLFTKNEEVTNFLECGEYNYNFVTTDVNYEFVYNNKTSLTIIPAILNVEVLNTVYTFNSQGNVLNYKITSNYGVDFTNNDYIVLNILNNNENVNLLNVGTYEFSFSSNNPNIILSSGNINGTVTIEPKQVSVENITTNLTYTGEELLFSYSLSEDIEVLVEIETLLNAGSYNYNIISQNNNYVIVNGTGIVVVNPKQIEILDINTNYVYNGLNINVTFSLEEEIETTVTFMASNSNEVLNNIINAGSYGIFVTPNNTNYVVDTTNIVITINPKLVDVTVTETTKTYNGTNNQISVFVEDDVTYCVTYYNELGEETVTTKNAGIYTYIVSTTNPNFNGFATGTLIVEKLSINLIVTADQYKVYGDNNEETYNHTLQGVLNGDSINIVLDREPGEDVGFYKINLIGYDNPNYIINYEPTNYKIIAKKLIIIADDVTKTFDSNEVELTYSISYGELVGNDTLNGALDREQGEDVGVYSINIGSLQSANPNYQIIFKKANFTIVPRNLNIKINNVITTYGTQVQLSYSVEGMYNESLIAGEITREQGENVGVYSITKGTLQSKNYNLIITNGTYTINPKTANVTPTTTQKTYGEEDNLTYTVSGLINNDVLKGSLGRVNGENAGSYLINLGSLQTLNPNYTFNLQETYFTINKAILTIDISSQTQVYGEEEKELTYTISGLIFNDEINLKPFRESGNDVGTYQISCGIQQTNNYVVLLNCGTYTITKAKASPILTNQISTYNGKVQTFTNTNFPYPLTYTYKRNGIQVDSVINAGNYIVQGYFAGNNNYEEAKSNAVTFTIKKVSVCFNLGNNNFIYDGEVKSPVFTFDSSLGLTSNAITFEFEGNIQPREVGSYNFTIQINDDNYEGVASGVLTITKPVTIVSDIAIIECDDAVADPNLSNLKLVNKVVNGNFNNQQILQACSFENTSGIEDGHIFTVRMRAKTNASNVYVYKIDKNNNATEVVVSVQDGYYVFKVDGLDCQYIITKDIEPMSLITIAAIIGVSIIVLVAIIVAFKVRKNRKKKLALKVANNNSTVTVEDVTTNNVDTNKNIKHKKLRVDDVLSGALNNGTINTNIESITEVKKDNIINENLDNKNEDANNTK